MWDKHKQEVKEIKINKSSDVALCIPTMSAASVTTNTIKNLLARNTNTSFDIIIVDNSSEDYKKIKEIFPRINYILMSSNTGSSGAQRTGIEVAIEYKYDYVILSDNDAELLTEDGLSKMLHYLKNHADVGCVAPSHISYLPTKDVVWNRQLPLHYLFIKTKVFEEFEPHNYYHFLMTDDVALTSKIVSNSKLVMLKEVTYYHETFKPRSLSNVCFYYYIRGFLITLLLEKNIRHMLKLRHFFHMCFKIILCASYSLGYKDPSYIKTVFVALKQYTNDYKTIDLNQVPKNKYAIKETEVSACPKEGYRKLSPLNSLIPPKRFYVYDTLKQVYRHYDLVASE